ncbi:uncharacterized protein EI90DRAFT_3010898 [Cantharellus anzutake]|uniref:uncharacterized protein n=1 Tax=Cantharellus anzutake TaxID=1750568 RepID=UPI0019059E17|nr:uncharacterized protein EI90DRAFT_3010898 [Cantharellus anzutake]KAF8344086.1 hypothetical protein EI90DRAFT_3010898 [Cantharellus anzutake]
MSIKLEIVPLSSRLEMHGSVQTSSSYSLSGHLLLSIPPFASTPINADPARPPSLRLTSLNITFEGKCESVSPQLGYAGTRLCRVSKNLIGEGGREPITLNCVSGNALEQPWQWIILFDLAIPGWLPASVDISEFTETGYSLHATAVLETPSPSSLFASKSNGAANSSGALACSTTKRTSAWSFPSFLCSPFKLAPKPKTVEAELVPITVVRVRSPPRSLPDGAWELLHDTPSLFPASLDLATPTVGASSLNPTESVGGIPITLLRSMDLAISLPEHVGIDEGFIPLGLKLRMAPDYAGGQHIRIHEFEVEVDQMEKSRSTEDSQFLQSFPLPTTLEQPPHLPLLNASHMECLDACGLLWTGIEATKATRRRPLVPDGRIYYRPSVGGIDLDRRWARMDVRVPVLRSSSYRSADGSEEQEDEKEVSDAQRLERRQRRGLVLPDSHSVYSRISHEISVCVKISWDPLEDEHLDRSLTPGRRYEEVRCVLPLHFTAVPESFAMSNKDGSTSVPCAACSASSPANPRFYSSSSSSSSSSLVTTANANTPPSWSPVDMLFSLPSNSINLHPTAACTCRPNLPAYSQLFYENGERKEEDEEVGWLPPYCPEAAEV